MTLTMDRELKERLELIAADAYTSIPTVAQVLLATAMHMGGTGADAALKEAVATIMDLQGKLCRCRQAMEANDPMNAYSIFGPPVPPPANVETTVPPPSGGVAPAPEAQA